MSQDLQFVQIKNFLLEEDYLKIKNDMINDFSNFYRKDDLKSGEQTSAKLFEHYKTQHWKNFYKKINDVMHDIATLNNVKEKKLTKSWCLKISKPQENFFHKHILTEDTYTSVYYLQNENYELGTHLKAELDSPIFPNSISEVIIPGYENSLTIFSGLILHDAVVPKVELNKPRYTIVTDYE